MRKIKCMKYKKNLLSKVNDYIESDQTMGNTNNKNEIKTSIL